MPFFELIWEIIGFLLAAAIIIGFVIAGAGVALAVVMVLLLIGWIPILAVATDVEWTMRVGFWGGLAFYATLVYLVAGVGFFALWMFVPDRDHLPQGFKALAFLWPHPAKSVVESHLASDQPAPVDKRTLREALTDLPADKIGNVLRKRQAEKLSELTKAKREARDANVELGKDFAGYLVDQVQTEYNIRTAIDPDPETVCKACDGSGKHRNEQGIFNAKLSCRSCHGTGRAQT